MIQVNWVKSTKQTWLGLETVDLSDVSTFGVYIIWHQGSPGRVVRLGQGDIAKRLGVHRNDRAILSYKSHGLLRVTWASVLRAQVDGVERYLADQWKPLVGDAFPDVRPIAVNSPW